MSLRLRNHLRLVRSEDGFTLIELSVVVGILVVVLVMLLTVLEGAQSTLATQVSRSSSNDQVRLAMQTIDRDVRSGDVLYDPAGEIYNASCSPSSEFPTCGQIQSGMALRIYTEANSPTRGGPRCVQWRITLGGELQRRSWSTDWQSSPSTKVSGWRIVATNITNRTDNVGAFTSNGVPNLINVELRANDDPTGQKGSTVDVQASISGRNTMFYPSAQMCGPSAPDPSITAPSPMPPLFEPVPSY